MAGAGSAHARRRAGILTLLTVKKPNRRAFAVVCGAIFDKSIEDLPAQIYKPLDCRLRGNDNLLFPCLPRRRLRPHPSDKSAGSIMRTTHGVAGLAVPQSLRLIISLTPLTSRRGLRPPCPSLYHQCARAGVEGKGLGAGACMSMRVIVQLGRSLQHRL